MHNRDRRRRVALLVLLAVLVAAFLRFSERSPGNMASSEPSRSASAAEAVRSPPAPESPRPAQLPPSTAPATSGATSRVTSTPQLNASPLQLQIQAPAHVQVGQSFDVRIDVGPNAGLHRLLFVVAFDAKNLALVSSLVGSLGRQTGAPVQFVAQETSYGSVQVTFETENGVWVTGAGTVAVLQLEATRAGRSLIALHDVTMVDAGGATYRNVIVEDATVESH